MSDDRTSSDGDWDDARLAGAYRALAAQASSVGVADAVARAIRMPAGRSEEVDRATDDPQPVLEEVAGAIRRIGSPAPASRSRPWRAWFAIAAALVVVAVGVRFAVVSQTPIAGPGGAHHYHAEGIDFDYPAAWSIHDRLPASSGFGSVWAIIGTHAWPASCGESDINCYYEAKLEPGTIAVDVGMSYMPATDVDLCTRGATGSDLEGRGPDDPIATRTLIRVEGRPTLRTTYAVGGKDYYGSDEWLDWEIAPVGSVDAAYFIDARVRGPNTEAMKADLDALIASIRLTASEIAGNDPTADCGAPFPAVSPSPPGPTASLLAPSSGTPAPPPSGATPLALPTEPPARPIPSGATYACALASVQPVRVARQGDSVTFVSVANGTVVELVWPRGFSARALGGRAEIVARDGTVLAREGDVLSGLGGGLGETGNAFHVCSVDGAMYLPTP